MRPGEGTCEHYGRVEYEKKFCSRCSLWFLVCPKCNPCYCPICMEEMKAKKKVIVKLENPAYYRAKKMSLNRLKAWKERNPEKVKGYSKNSNLKRGLNAAG